MASKSQQPVKKKIADSQRLRQSDQVRGPVAQDAHAMTLTFGVAPRDQRTGILHAWRRCLASNRPIALSLGSTLLSQIISPFVSTFEAWARFETGDTSVPEDVASAPIGPTPPIDLTPHPQIIALAGLDVFDFA